MGRLVDLSVEGIGNWLGGAAAAVMAAAFGFQKARAHWAKNDNDIEKAKGEGDVVALLRTELTRMAEQNDKLANLVNKLQYQVIELSGKNARLKQQIESLDFELRAMRGPVDLSSGPMELKE